MYFTRRSLHVLYLCSLAISVAIRTYLSGYMRTEIIHYAVRNKRERAPRLPTKISSTTPILLYLYVVVPATETSKDV
ncbi:hypothetical protein F5B22DRAFT_585284 [Xylaria bambusicola]|uniref:uncharacterized protein n=1 Tax=Xylaria bambusicola TaxID=326684 RepID=UPI002008DA13|nr:uncharacterized protein F5B22DRAFT_585284 [Xylaria bambusicola]KAI0526317.1 hypothetical protein F5B22DRAFT_585284 [Xylaria bambusicola]